MLDIGEAVRTYIHEGRESSGSPESGSGVVYLADKYMISDPP